MEAFLVSDGWVPDVSFGRSHVVDIEAKRGTDKWIIKVKGSSSLNPEIINSFVSVLGEILQRMDDQKCKYSLALPDTKPFRRLWERLPTLAKERTGITALFVSQTGKVTEILK
jgi:hypothetical protein